MATPIAATPVLRGRAAADFLERLYANEGKKVGPVPTPKIWRITATKAERRGYDDTKAGITSNPYPSGCAQYWNWNRGLQRFYKIGIFTVG